MQTEQPRTMSIPTPQNSDGLYCPKGSVLDCFDVELYRQRCLETVKPSSRLEYREVALCVLTDLNELQKAFLSSRMYLITLWPAFVGLISSMFPDPSEMVYDNIWWSILFSITCAGIPGLSKSLPAHHMVVESVSRGEAACRSWEYDGLRHPRTQSRIAMRNNRSAAPQMTMEWIFFSLGVALFIAFSILFAVSLNNTISLDANLELPQIPAIWYWLSAGPSLLSLLSEVFQNRVDLYEPMLQTESAAKDINEHVRNSLGADEGSRRDSRASPTPSTKTVRQFCVVSHLSFPKKWLRILRHQWRRSEYRILVRPPSIKWPYQTWRMVVAMSRIAVFAWGSIEMGSLVLMPMPQDFVCLILLLFTTALPRVGWWGLWEQGARGADLVVSVKPIFAH